MFALLSVIALVGGISMTAHGIQNEEVEIPTQPEPVVEVCDWTC